MKVYGALEVAQLEWFTDATKPAASSYIYRVIYVSDLKQIQVSDGTTWRPSNVTIYTTATLPAAGATNQYQVAFVTDTLQLRVSNGSKWVTAGARLDTYTSGTIPAAASNTNQVIWVSDLQQMQVSNGTSWVQVGSKAGAKNYFSQSNANPDFETNSVSPWSAATVTFSSGAPSGAPTLSATQMSIAPTATTPLSGTYSMLLTKTANNAQYQGFASGILTIDRSDLAKVLYGSFSYEVTSASTSVDFSGGSTQSLEIWVYNVNAGTWIQPAGYRGMNQSSGPGKVTFSFQTDSTVANNQYRVVVFTQQTSATAYTIEFDDFQLGPSAIVLGAAVSDWQTYTPTWSVTSGTAPVIGNGTLIGKWRRVGDQMECRVRVAMGSTTTYGSGNYTFSIPSGFSIDPNKLPAGVVNSDDNRVGFGSYVRQSSNRWFYFLNIYSATQVVAVISPDGTSGFVTSNSLLNQSSPAVVGNGDVIDMTFSVPISGWSSNVQLSQDTDTRVVAASYNRSTTQTIPASTDTTVIYDLQRLDTHSAMNTSTGRYTIPVSGTYRISASVFFTNFTPATSNVFQMRFIKRNSAGTITDNVYKDNFTANAAVAQETALRSSGLFSCVAGDTLEVILFQNTSTAKTTIALINFVDIERLSGPSVIASSETVAMIAKNSSGQSIPAGSSTTITGWTKDYDSHGSFNASTGIYTAPISGEYSVKCGILYSQAVVAVGAQYSIQLQKSGSDYIVLGGRFTETTQSVGVSVGGSGSIRLNAGETINIQTYQASGGSRSLSTASAWNFLVIEKVGN